MNINQLNALFRDFMQFYAYFSHIQLLKTDYLFSVLHECMSRKRVSPRNPFSVRYSTDLV